MSSLVVMLIKIVEVPLKCSWAINGLIMQIIDWLQFSLSQIIALRNETRQDFVCKQGDIDLVTETDKEVEQLLMNGIKEQFPDHQ